MNTQKTAIVTGCNGQDGSYLMELLLDKNYSVHGLIRRASTDHLWRIRHLLHQVTLHTCDMGDQSSLNHIIKKVQPDEVYNLAAQSFVHSSWDVPISTADITAIGVLRLLEAIRNNKPDAKFYQASSSEMFGKVVETPQNERTPFYPRSPYGVAKVYGHYITVNYRESYNMFCVSGILFNHESPRRGLEFVTKKITHSVAKIKLGLQDKLYLGNLKSKRDWGHAKDYVLAMWQMLQQEQPEDYVIGTGKTYSIEDFLKMAFNLVNLDYKDFVDIDHNLYRPSEVETLCADASKANKNLNWYPTYDITALITDMMNYDLWNVKNG